MHAMIERDDIGLQALQSLQMRIGGELRGRKLYPLGPHLTTLHPLEEQCELQRQWYAVQTASQQEHKVVEALTKSRLDAYCPLEPKSVRINHSRRTIRHRPMLVGYVFVGFDVEHDGWPLINLIDGVIRLLMFGDRPIPISDSVIEHIRMEEHNRQYGKIRKLPRIMLQPGTLVRLLEPFAFHGLFGFVSRINQQQHLVDIEVEIFGRKTTVRLRPEQVESV